MYPLRIKDFDEGCWIGLVEQSLVVMIIYTVRVFVQLNILYSLEA